MSTFKKRSVTAVYALGALITGFLLCMFIAHSDFVPNPEAMLPMQQWEAASVLLAFGALPMAAASLLLDKVYAVRQTAHRRRNQLLIYAPAMICGCFLVFWIAVWAIAILKMIFLGMA